MTMNFKKWLEDTGEVRVATLTNEPLGIRSKYTQDANGKTKNFGDHLKKRQRQK